MRCQRNYGIAQFGRVANVDSQAAAPLRGLSHRSIICANTWTSIPQALTNGKAKPLKDRWINSEITLVIELSELVIGYLTMPNDIWVTPRSGFNQFHNVVGIFITIADKMKAELRGRNS